MAALTVNLDTIAVARAMRRRGEPDPAQAAVLAELGGADGISVQMRRDRKYIRERDLYLLKGIVKTKLVVEIPPTDDLVEKMVDVKPWMVVLVADHADSDSPVSPVDFAAAPLDYSSVISRLSGVGINVGCFVEPSPDEVKGAARAGATSVLINCANFAEARTLEEAQSALDLLDKACMAAARQSLAVYCGRGLTYKNIKPLVDLGNIDEFVIGHAINSRGLLVGLDRAVGEMLHTLRPAASA